MLGGQPASVCHTYCKSMNTKKDSKIPNSNFNEIIRKAMRIDAAWLKEIHILSCPNDLLSMLSLLQ